MKEHLYSAVNNAMITDDSKYIRRAVAEEVLMPINVQTINRIKRTRLLNKAWKSLWLKLPSFVKTINTRNKHYLIYGWIMKIILKVYF